MIIRYVLSTMLIGYKGVIPLWRSNDR